MFEIYVVVVFYNKLKIKSVDRKEKLIHEVENIKIHCVYM